MGWLAVAAGSMVARALVAPALRLGLTLGRVAGRNAWLAWLLAGWALGSRGAEAAVSRARRATLLRLLADPDVDLRSLLAANVLTLPAYLSLDAADYERVRWVNELLLGFWPGQIGPTLCSALRQAAAGALSDLEGAGLHRLSVEALSLGPAPPVLGGVRARAVPGPRGCGCGELLLDVDVRLVTTLVAGGGVEADSGEESEGAAYLVIAARTPAGLPLRLRLSQLSAVATLRLSLSPWPLGAAALDPNFLTLSASLLRTPAVDFELRLLGGDLTALPGAEAALRRLLAGALEPFVWPRKAVMWRQGPQPPAAAAATAAATAAPAAAAAAAAAATTAAATAAASRARPRGGGGRRSPARGAAAAAPPRAIAFLYRRLVRSRGPSPRARPPGAPAAAVGAAAAAAGAADDHGEGAEAPATAPAGGSDVAARLSARPGPPLPPPPPPPAAAAAAAAGPPSQPSFPPPFAAALFPFPPPPSFLRRPAAAVAAAAAAAVAAAADECPTT